MSKDLLLLRGLPGAGKSTFAILLQENFLSSVRHFEADQFFTDENGNYSYDGMFIGDAHLECQRNAESSMKEHIPTIIVSNTFTREKELAPYLDLAIKYGYRVTTLIVENRENRSSVHSVPLETIEKMKNRFSVKL